MWTHYRPHRLIQGSYIDDLICGSPTIIHRGIASSSTVTVLWDKNNVPKEKNKRKKQNFGTVLFSLSLLCEQFDRIGDGQCIPTTSAPKEFRRKATDMATWLFSICMPWETWGPPHGPFRIPSRWVSTVLKIILLNQSSIKGNLKNSLSSSLRKK